MLVIMHLMNYLQKTKMKKITITICLVALLIFVIHLESSNNVTLGFEEDTSHNRNFKLISSTGIVINDSKIASYSASGTGISTDPYIIDNLYIDTTDSLALEFDGVSGSTYYVLRDSKLKGNTYGVYVSDSNFGTVSVINCTVEGALSIGGPNAREMFIHNNTLIFSQGSSFRKGITFTENVIILQSQYSSHLGRFQKEDNIIKDNIFYGNNSEILFNNVINTTIENNILHSAGFYFSNNDIMETTSNTIDGNLIDGKPYGFFYNKTGEIIEGNIYGQIYLFNSANSEIKNHTLIGSGYGIQIHKCTDVIVNNVTIEGKNGIEVKESDDILIKNNTLEGYNSGIDLNFVNDTTLQNNHLVGFAYGIEGFLVDGLYIYNNTLLDSEENGIYLDDSDNIEIKFNIITVIDYVPGSDLALVFWGCENIAIYYNIFLNLVNNSGSPVEGSSSINVMWYDATLEVGNHYSDWNGTGDYYLIPGDVGSLDLYPFIDVDKDLLNEYDEVMVYHTNPFEADTDMDGLDDGEEVNTYSTDPLDEDSDDDGLLDGEEVDIYGTSPTNPDTDGDGHTDYEEVQAGTDPLDPEDFPKDAPLALILGLIFGLGIPVGVAAAIVVLARKGKIKLQFITKK